MKAYEFARSCRKLTKSDRARERSAWLDKRLEQLGGRGDVHIQRLGGPTYKTIQRYRSGQITPRTHSVRTDLAKAFMCDLSEVPE